MLHALLINTKPLKSEIPTGSIMRLNRPRQEKRTLHIQILHTILHHAQLQRNHPRHLDSATERNLAITLREMQISNGEFRPGHVDGKECPAATAQVLDIAVASVLGTAGDCTCAFFADFFFYLVRSGASVDVLRLRGLSDDAFQFCGGDEFGFAAVPFGEDFGGRGAAHDAGMDQAWETDVRQVSGGAEDALEVPDGFRAERSQWVDW